jgi:hypothetical protein
VTALAGWSGALSNHHSTDACASITESRSYGVESAASPADNALLSDRTMRLSAPKSPVPATFVII